MSVGIVEHSILQYVLQYGFAVLQYIAICFLPYCCTPNTQVRGRIKFVADLKFEWRKQIINAVCRSTKKVHRIFSPNRDMKELFSLANSGA